MKKTWKKILAGALAMVLTVGAFAANPVDVSAASPSVVYQTHCQNVGTQGEVRNGQRAGTEGQSLRMEAVRIRLEGVSGGVTYQAHVQNIGWQSPVSNYAWAGTTGQSLRMEAIKINLTGDAAKYYDIQYRAHSQNVGWGAWVSNGAVAGTTGRGLRMEAIEIRLVAKSGGSNSGSTSSGYAQKVNQFINDSRWKNGASWGASKRPAISTYGSASCCAYAADFVKYVFNNNSPRGGRAFSNPSEIKAGDVIYVTGTDHWFVVLERNGNTLKTAEGNWGGKVVISNGTYTISGNTLMRSGAKFRTFNTGYHFQ